MQQDQGNESGHLDDQPDNEAAPKHDWFQTPDKPQTPDRAWNKTKSIDSRPPQKWISTIAKARQPPRMFNELMDTPIDFLAYVMNRLKIDNLTQEILVGHAFNLLKGSCKSFAELEYLPTDYFINNDLEYLKGRSLSSKYVTSTTRTKAAKCDNIEGIEDMVPTLWSPVKKVLRLMRSDKLYKFCDETLSSVRHLLHDIASNLEMDYLPKRHWSNLEMKRSRIMVKAIDKLLFEMRLMHNLEKFVGGHDYGNDIRLLEQTI
ncbi:hypothetical protein Tco_0379197 [Tanacetum coccineum]